jgi:D-beta-D-heptose 7-phosphate kinase/D-beta-D-heptose 1-phosphate adenosyltransferase
MDSHPKIISDLNSFLQHLDRKNQTIVFTNGCFDLLHQGHLHLLQAAKKLGDLLIVAVNNDDSIKRLKGESRPIESLETRLSKLCKLDEVDFVISFSNDTPLHLIQKIQPDRLVKGGDYLPENIIGKEFVKQVITIPLLEGFSTTQIISKNN